VEENMMEGKKGSENYFIFGGNLSLMSLWRLEGKYQKLLVKNQETHEVNRVVGLKFELQKTIVGYRKNFGIVCSSSFMPLYLMFLVDLVDT
jgi:hypothetical protein